MNSTPPPARGLNRPRRRRWLRPTLCLVGLYALSLVFLVVFEDRLAFRGWTFRKPWIAPPSDVKVEEVTIAAADGNRIVCWWLPPPKTNTPLAAGAVLYIHGNGENVTTTGTTLARWSREMMNTPVLGIDYPGYGHSTGRPGEESCSAAAVAAFDWLVNEKKIAAREIIVVGQSMGAAIATDLVAQRPCRLLVTSGAFTSFPDAAQHQYFWLPARYLVRLRFDNLGRMPTLRTPIFIAHGAKDHTVPLAHGELLTRSVRKAAYYFYPMPNHGHSHPKSPEFFKAVRAFLATTAFDAKVRPKP